MADIKIKKSEQGVVFSQMPYSHIFGGIRTGIVSCLMYLSISSLTKFFMCSLTDGLFRNSSIDK